MSEPNDSSNSSSSPCCRPSRNRDSVFSIFSNLSISKGRPKNNTRDTDTPPSPENLEESGARLHSRIQERVEGTKEQLSVCEEEKMRCVSDTTAKFDNLISILTNRKAQCLDLINNRYEHIENNLKDEIIRLEKQRARLDKTMKEVQNPAPIHLDVKQWSAYSTELQRLQTAFSDSMQSYSTAIKCIEDMLREKTVRWRVRVRFEEDMTEKLCRYGKVKEVNNREYKPQSRMISGKSEHVNLQPKYRVVCDTLRGLEIGDVCYFNKLLYIINVSSKSYCIFSIEGDFLEEVFYREHVPVDKCKEGIAVSKQYVYIVSWIIHSILAYSHHGHLTRCVSSLSKIGNFNSPFHPCIDSLSNLMVADRLNHRVLRLSAPLTESCIVLRDDTIDRMFAMRVDENDVIIIAHQKVLKFYNQQGEQLALHDMTHLFPKMFHFKPNVMCPLPFGFMLVGDFEWMFLYHQDEERIFYLRTKHQFLSYTIAGMLCAATDNALNFFDLGGFM
ncbi:hypothetical protein LOD99_1656 [Oopsacas minuta]|uniref:Uncharacterized protein n=1 Tax=Oopsacas minuta TaxID=111878 RepID=A0AAV7K3V4_9METZ|nr:hypothetical protein LOD99_1656 [Oopsacas minuta]